MATRIISQGRVIWQDSAMYRQVFEARLRKSAVPFDADGNLINHAPITVEQAHSPFRVGEAFFDAEDDVVYRVVTVADPREGWATTRFWQDRWEIPHKIVLKMAKRGMLDAVRLANSQAKYYRCRDERIALQDPILVKAQVKRKNLKEKWQKNEETRKTRSRQLRRKLSPL